MTARARKHADEYFHERLTAVLFGLNRRFNVWEINTILKYGEKWRKKQLKRVLKHLRKIDKPYYTKIMSEVLKMKEERNA